MLALSRMQRRIDSFRSRMIDSVLSKRGPLTPPFEIVYRRIFILPTSFGWVFGLLLVTMTIGGLNFNNNLGLLLTFLLAASAHATLHMAYSNLRGIQLMAIEHQPVFAGKPAQLEVQLRDTQGRARPGIEIRCGKTIAAAHLTADKPHTLTLMLPTVQRGWLKLPRVRISTSYPLGMFYAWSWSHAARDVLVYPRPAQEPPILPQGSADQGILLRLQNGEDLIGVRDYQRGDGLPSIAWKASARHQQMQTKLLAQSVSERLVLDWYRLEGTDIEQRLSILCAWVLAADRNGQEYRLRLPNTELGPAHGSAHRDRCLKALALYGL